MALEHIVADGILELADVRAQDPAATGTKAAALARARAEGLPVLPGFVITTSAASSIAGDLGWARGAWSSLSDDGARALVVRSSSPLEDTTETSMAGRFTSVVDVRGWEAFQAAVETVVASAGEVAEAEGIAAPDVPMAVLVQPLVEPRVGGVMFGVEPVTGRTDRRVVAAVRGLPERLVSGEVSGSRYEIDASGRRRAYDGGDERVRVSRRDRGRLVDLSDRCARLFGAPQDLEWALDDDGTLSLLQSRPVTTPINGIPAGPVLGPGPIAETFPEPLARLEQDLWAEPLRQAFRTVFDVLGVTSRRRLERSPLLVVVDGRVAVDLDLLEAAERAPWWAFVRQSRALRAAWRIGRLRAALVGIGEDAVARADAALLEVPNARDLTDRQLVAALENLRGALRSLHSHEMLVGLVLHPSAARLTGSSIALRVLAQARREGLDDADIPRHYPIVVSLVPPRVAASLELPAEIAVPEWAPGEEDRAAVVREALRLRVRWAQEAGARFAWELGERLVRTGALEEAAQVRDLGIESLEMTVRDLAVTVKAMLEHEEVRTEPLPARFRLSERGRPVPVVDRHPHQGTGVGGGRGRGPVHIGADDVPDGAVVVVRTLDARLAPILPRLAGLVAETGSVLAHLAILARESGVPTVVGLEGATGCLPDGAVVEVDGTTGAVTRVPDAGADAPSGGAGAMIRKAGWLLGVVMLFATGGYTFVYLYRWEWNRALFTSVLFVAVEVGVVTVLVLRRLARVERVMAESASAPAVLARVRESAPEHDHFAWLERTTSRTGVFVTVLLGAGVLLSAASWLVDRVASRTAVPTLERGLVERLRPTAFPEEPLVPADAELLAQGGPYGQEHLGILLGPR